MILIVGLVTVLPIIDAAVQIHTIPCMYFLTCDSLHAISLQLVLTEHIQHYDVGGGGSYDGIFSRLHRLWLH